MLLLSPTAAALDLGVIGPAYTIAEPDLLAELQAKLREKARTGELQELERAARQRIVAAIETPPLQINTHLKRTVTFVGHLRVAVIVC